jgi:hypothetical protein
LQQGVVVCCAVCTFEPQQLLALWVHLHRITKPHMGGNRVSRAVTAIGTLPTHACNVGRAPVSDHGGLVSAPPPFCWQAARY